MAVWAAQQAQPLMEGPGCDRDLWQGLGFSSPTAECQGPPGDLPLGMCYLFTAGMAKKVPLVISWEMVPRPHPF